MLKNLQALTGSRVYGIDAEIGKVTEFFFDDVGWTVRFVVVKTGKALGHREVLVSPLSVTNIDNELGTIQLSLTREQVEHSPSVSSELPVSRQKEMEYLSHYNLPFYWAGPFTWGGYPIPLAVNPLPETSDDYERAKLGDVETTNENHLQSTKDVRGYKVSAEDSIFGNVVDFVVDLKTWAIRYLVVDTVSFWPSKHVLISPIWCDAVSWEQRSFLVQLSKEAIKSAPAYDPKTFTEKHETELFAHFQRPTYWDSNVNLPGAGILSSKTGSVEQPKAD